MRKALWFSRHEPTQKQMAELEIIVDPEATELASIPMDDWPEVGKVVRALIDLCRRWKVSAIAGVFPTPMLYWALPQYGTKGELTLFAAWNVNRAPAGEPPKFEHREFLVVGYLAIND